ncbi:hypothetical protein VTH82DRAFT_5904 [Thermothelomyces myriococcoides]
MSTHVPAWKRLGLKLKGPTSGEATTRSTGPNAPRVSPASQVTNSNQNRTNGSLASALKRKLPSSASAPNAASAQTPNKKPRREDQSAANQGTPSSLKKSVSFAEGTKDNSKNKAEKKKKKKAKKKNAKKTNDAPKTDTNLEPSLNYLRQWHTARDSWKFNKNHQTLLIKYVFDVDKVPSSDIAIFYEYIRNLKGFVRTRLRETAVEIKQKDMEAGAGAFPANLKDREAKQKEYEETISQFLQDCQQQQQQQQEKTKGNVKNSNGKRTLDEVNYVLRIATPEVKQRLVKRIRAEQVSDVLSESEESTSSGATVATATTTSTSSSSSSSGRGAVAVADGTAGTRRGDGSQQPAKRRRLRNVRTNIGDDDDDSSSSSSSSSSGSGSTSGGSSDSSSDSESEESDSEEEESSSESDESSSDDEMDMAPGGEATDSSSSSSSSSSESGSEADTESDDESESGSSSSEDD